MKGSRVRIRAEQVPLRVETDATLQTAEIDRNSGAFLLKYFYRPNLFEWRVLNVFEMIFFKD